jgi:hypothetical protein
MDYRTFGITRYKVSGLLLKIIMRILISSRLDWPQH